MSAAIEFTPWPKTPRLFRDAVITEKIDGTNAVGITHDGAIYAQSRNRIITPDADNAGFAAWVAANAGTLTDDLGPGLHFGEWWGSGIQRGYGLTGGEKRFSLFNTHRFGMSRTGTPAADFYTPGLHVVPTLFVGPMDTAMIRGALQTLVAFGSLAASGYMNPEGVCVYHSAARQVFNVTLEHDGVPKSATQ